MLDYFEDGRCLPSADTAVLIDLVEDDACSVDLDAGCAAAGVREFVATISPLSLLTALGTGHLP